MRFKCRTTRNFLFVCFFLLTGNWSEHRCPFISHMSFCSKAVSTNLVKCATFVFCSDLWRLWKGLVIPQAPVIPSLLAINRMDSWHLCIAFDISVLVAYINWSRSSSQVDSLNTLRVAATASRSSLPKDWALFGHSPVTIMRRSMRSTIWEAVAEASAKVSGTRLHLQDTSSTIKYRAPLTRALVMVTTVCVLGETARASFGIPAAIKHL